jgi:MYXO-CTERM domain-containing protein
MKKVSITSTRGKSAKVMLGTVTALAAINNSDAAIVYFDVNPDIAMNDANRDFKFDLSNGTYQVSTSLTLTGQRFIFESDLIKDNTFAIVPQAGAQAATYGSGGDLSQLTFGATINAGSFTWLDYSYGGSFYTPSGWNGTNQSGYAGLRINAGGGNYNYGWVALNWTQSPDILTISGFAFENSYNTAILAGDQGGGSAAVPEPGQLASSVLLLAGIAGYFAHRRRAAAGAEPSALHKLALGARGIADFRADKAA